MIVLPPSILHWGRESATCHGVALAKTEAVSSGVMGIPLLGTVALATGRCSAPSTLSWRLWPNRGEGTAGVQLEVYAPVMGAIVIVL